MPSGGRGFAPPKSAQWVVSHYRIITSNASVYTLTACRGLRPLTPDGSKQPKYPACAGAPQNYTLRVCMSASIFRRAYERVGLPPAGAAVGVSHVVVCAGGCNVGIITLYQ